MCQSVSKLALENSDGNCNQLKGILKRGFGVSCSVKLSDVEDLVKNGNGEGNSERDPAHF